MAVVLAGGRARRMGGADKCLLLLDGRPLVDHVLNRLRGQVRCVLINSNGDPGRFAAWNCPVVADVIPGQGGPLVGVLSALEWAREHAPGVADVLTVPGDGPFLPAALARRLAAARDAAGARVAVAESGGRLQPVVALWSVELAPALRHAIVADGVAKVEEGIRRFPFVAVPFEAGPPDPFFNVNTAADLAAAEAILAADRS